jgi:hypothetical protein
MVVPGRNRARMLVRASGEVTGVPLTAVMTDPPVIPAVAAGLPHTVPSTRGAGATGATVDGMVRLALLV